MEARGLSFSDWGRSRYSRLKEAARGKAIMQIQWAWGYAKSFGSAEVVAPGFQQRGTEHDIAILATFSPADVDHHSVAVDIGDLQLAKLGAPRPRATERHQYNAVKRSLGRVNEAGHFFGAQDARKVLRFLGVRCFGYAPWFFQRLNEEERQESIVERNTR